MLPNLLEYLLNDFVVEEMSPGVVFSDLGSLNSLVSRSLSGSNSDLIYTGCVSWSTGINGVTVE